MRAFIAVEISESAREKITALVQNLQSTGANVKWVEPQNLHLTLKFLGDVSDEQLRAFQQKLSAAIKTQKSFSFELVGAGAFPSFKRARAIWLGIEEGKEGLIELARIVEEESRKLGFPTEERTFQPHLTLGRVRSEKGWVKLAALLQGLTLREKMTANQVTLFESKLSSAGPVHTPLNHWALTTI